MMSSPGVDMSELAFEAESSSVKQPRILIADDDVTSRLMLKSVLCKYGYEVMEAGDGKVALEILTQPSAPRLAILDWMMPEMNGLEVVRLLRQLPCDVPHYLLMLTSREGKKDIIAGLDAGANDYLTKPFDVLCMLSRFLNESVRAYDSVGRIGGEEFMLVAPLVPGNRAEPLFGRLRERIAGTAMETRSGLLSVTISIGVAVCRQPCSADALFAAADAALYKAKALGRNRVEYSDAAIR